MVVINTDTVSGLLRSIPSCRQKIGRMTPTAVMSGTICQFDWTVAAMAPEGAKTALTINNNGKRSTMISCAVIFFPVEFFGEQHISGDCHSRDYRHQYAHDNARGFLSSNGGHAREGSIY